MWLLQLINLCSDFKELPQNYLAGFLTAAKPKNNPYNFTKLRHIILSFHVVFAFPLWRRARTRIYINIYIYIPSYAKEYTYTTTHVTHAYIFTFFMTYIFCYLLIILIEFYWKKWQIGIYHWDLKFDSNFTISKRSKVSKTAHQ